MRVFPRLLARPLRGWIAALLFGLSAALPALAARREAGGRAATAQLQWRKIAGWVEAKDVQAHRLAVRDRYGNLASVTVDSQVQIFRNWRLVALDDVKVRDHVILRHVYQEL